MMERSAMEEATNAQRSSLKQGRGAGWRKLEDPESFSPNLRNAIQAWFNPEKNRVLFTQVTTLDPKRMGGRNRFKLQRLNPNGTIDTLFKAVGRGREPRREVNDVLEKFVDPVTSFPRPTRTTTVRRENLQKFLEGKPIKLPQEGDDVVRVIQSDSGAKPVLAMEIVEQKEKTP